MNTFTLYGTQACHLCEQARDMIDAVKLGPYEFQLEVVDISEQEGLFERYGIRIPVLQHTDKRELDCPFTANQLRTFLDS